MDKKVWIALILSVVVIFFYPYLIKWYYPQQEPVAVQQAPVDAAAPAAQQGATGAASREAMPATIAEELTTVETPLYKAVFTNAGGAIKSLELKNYSRGQNDPVAVNVVQKVAVLNSFKSQFDINGIVETPVLSSTKKSFNITGAEKAELVYTGTLSNGLVIEKKFVFSADAYFMQTEVSALNKTATAVSVRSDLVLSAPVSGKDDTGYHQGPIVKTAKELTRQDEDDKTLTGSSKLRWLGLEDKYFLAAIIPVTEVQFSWVTEVPSAGSSRATLQFPVNLAPNGVTRVAFTSFLGPKEYDTLLGQKNGLEEAIEFGWFDWMAKPFLVVLNFFNRYIGNYGIAIIVLTVIIKVLFYPLTKKSLHSMRDMQKMQPQMAALKEKYKGDKEKMNKELMELYKRHKLNPVGGCLPMVLQIPVFIALYEVLYVAIELRHAPFFLWITDLSAKDPYYITPVLMGATMFLQQKMTPSAVDPAQQKIMMLMPVIFTFMFLSFPAGLVLYWLVNNVLSIGQQYFVYKTPAKA
ncbi:MAG: membrane protein insertase YidC [Deltaproteobacteria bacterium]|nr:membrane protein insertase YidC [Deltaproteobacteria bacterium]